MTEKGWAKVPRRLLATPAFHDEKMLKVYLYIAISASIEDSQLCKAGECCVSTRKIAEDTGMSRQNVRTAIKKLEKMALIGHYERGFKKASVYAIVPVKSMQKSGSPPDPDFNPDFDPDFDPEKSTEISMKNTDFWHQCDPDFDTESNPDSNHRYDNIYNGCTPVGTGAPPLEEKESETQQPEFNEYGCEPYYDEFPWRKGR